MAKKFKNGIIFSDSRCEMGLIMELYGLIFDVDGVIADTEAVNARASIKVFEDLFGVKGVRKGQSGGRVVESQVREYRQG